jgi:hypothetical protein
MADQPPASGRIFTYLGARIPVRCNEHIAIVQQGDSAEAWGMDFLSEGLRMGHRCCCVAPAASRFGMLTRLREFGTEVERHLCDETLQFPMAAQGAGELLDWAKRFFAEAETARAPGVRWLEEGVWAKPTDISVPQFFELHSRLNYLVKQYPSVALCRYDTEQLEIPHLFSAIAVHRHLLVEGTLVRDNPFYIPAEKFLAMSPEDRERDLRDVFREVGFDLAKLLSTLAGYGQLQAPAPPEP